MSRIPKRLSYNALHAPLARISSSHWAEVVPNLLNPSYTWKYEDGLGDQGPEYPGTRDKGLEDSPGSSDEHPIHCTLFVL